MTEELLLLDLFYYFAVTALIIPVFCRYGLGSVLGYLTAGIFLGPHGFSLLHHVQNIHDISQIGIIMLMFVIGLELTPPRISHLKRTILLEGNFQFILSTGALAFPLKLMGFDWPLSLLLGASLALSSTAFSLSWLKESGRLTKSYGQSATGILIYQDLLIVPLLMVIPFVSGNNAEVASTSKIILSMVIVATLLVSSRYILMPALNRVYESGRKEVFIGSCLMFVSGSALVMGHLGLSKALGALIAGMFLSSSRLKSDIQKFSLPIKTMLMGVFFMGFGLNFDLNYFYNNFSTILLYTSAFMGIKAAILVAVSLISNHKYKSSALCLGLLLCQGGEFGLLAISSLIQHSLLEASVAQTFLSCITLSIFVAPFLTKVIITFEKIRSKTEEQPQYESNVVEFKQAS